MDARTTWSASQWPSRCGPPLRTARARLASLRRALRALTTSGALRPERATLTNGVATADAGEPADPAPLLAGHVDEPVAGSVVPHGRFTVRGWTTWDGSPPAAVVASVGATVVAAAAVGTEARPDVAAAFGQEALVGAGWTMTADLSGFAAGAQVVLAIAILGDGAGAPQPFATVPVTVDLGRRRAGSRPGAEPTEPFLGALDAPLLGRTLGPRTDKLSGWLLHPSEPVSRIDVVINGSPAGAARLGLARPDVAGRVGQAAAAVSGFEHTFDLHRAGVVPGGLCKIQLVARVAGEAPTVVLDGVWRRGAAEALPDRDGRAEVVWARAEHRRGRVVAPGGPGLDLVVLTHHLGFGGAQLWLDELLGRAGAGSEFACTVISPADGPLRSRLRGAGDRRPPHPAVSIRRHRVLRGGAKPSCPCCWPPAATPPRWSTRSDATWPPARPSAPGCRRCGRSTRAMHPRSTGARRTGRSTRSSPSLPCAHSARRPRSPSSPTPPAASSPRPSTQDGRS